MTTREQNLLNHHIENTRDQFAELKEDLKTLTEKVNTLNEFKIGLIVSSRTTSLIVSAICGFLTLLITTFVSIKFR